jgi:GT2 family glycosyltransferase
MKLVVAFLCYNESSARYLSEFLVSLDQALASLTLDILVLAGDNSDKRPYTNNLLIDDHNRHALFPARVLSFTSNLGFAAAYNRLINEAVSEKADYFLMLNPDMCLEKDSLSILLAHLIARPNLTAVCPKIYRWDFSKSLRTNIIDSCGICWRSGLRFYDVGQGEEDDGHHDEAKIAGPSGAAALFRLADLERIKENGFYFDERFFMYKEDCDLSYRLVLAGLKTELVPQSIVYHDRSAAVKNNLWCTWRDWHQRSHLSRSWSFLNQHLIFIKHWSQESFWSRLGIIFQVLFLSIFSLIFANFLWKNYPRLWRIFRSID